MERRGRHQQGLILTLYDYFSLHTSASDQIFKYLVLFKTKDYVLCYYVFSVSE